MLAASAREGAARTRQRVSAALGWGEAPPRASNTVTPEAFAASARRRLAVRSNSGAAPHSSMKATPPEGWRAASSPACNAARVSRARTRMIAAGSRPKAARPGG